MCLIIKKFSLKRIATSDIECYKFLYINKEDYIHTPYQMKEVHINETYESEIKLKNRFSPFFQTEGHKGLHTFVDKEKAMEYVWGKNRVLAICIIPKGSTFYIGNFQGNRGYISNSLKYVEIVRNL